MGKKKPPKKLIQMTPKSMIANLLAGETDRGCVLVGAAFLEFRVYELVRGRLRENSDIELELIEKLFFHPQSLLGGLWAKTVIAFCFGLIDRKHYDLLEDIRELRNNFAHCPGPVELDDVAMQRILSRLNKEQLRWIKTHQDGFKSALSFWRSATSSDDPGFSKARIAFMETCLEVNKYLNQRIGEIDPQEREAIREFMKKHPQFSEFDAPVRYSPEFTRE